MMDMTSFLMGMVVGTALGGAVVIIWQYLMED